MCGRYGFSTSDSELIERFDLEMAEYDLYERYQIAPTQEAPVIERHSPNSLHSRKWGIFPSFMKGGVLINAQVEKVERSPVWRTAFRESRCLVPFNWFFEWQVQDDKSKQPFLISLKGKKLASFAGLIARATDKEGKEHEGFVIVTTEANEMMKVIHNTKHRMPVILTKEDEDVWLNPDASPEQLHACLKEYPDSEMDSYKVSTLVSSPKNTAKEIIEPLK